MTLPFDPVRRGVDTNAVKKVKMWPGSTPEFGADDFLEVGVEGIVFAHQIFKVAHRFLLIQEYL